jgi:hypothetical protein
LALKQTTYDNMRFKFTELKQPQNKNRMSLIELILLIVVLLTGLSIVWSTLITGISPMMSSTKACQVMLDSVDGKERGSYVDLGSGWGTLVVALARKYPNKQVVGYELSWLPWLVSFIRKTIYQLDNLTIYRSDFRKEDIRNSSVLFCYLFPKGMVSLNEKLTREVTTDVVIISNTFALPSCKPEKVVVLTDLFKTPIYVYYWQPKNND